MLRDSDRCIQIVVIVLISGLMYGSVVTDPPKEMHLTYANPPIWHLRYKDRLLIQSETFTMLRKNQRTDIVDTTLSNTTKFPWKDLPGDTVIIHMQCLNDYDNPELMKHIENGYIGRMYRLLGYLSIIDCFLQHLTSTTFRGLTMLSSLTIQSKYIKYLPLDVFSNLPNLLMIKMEFCSLTTLSGDLFCHNPKITFAKFGYNNIRAITSGELANETCYAGSINSLGLNGNKLGNFINVNFENFDLNGILTFSNCSIRYISNATFHGLSNVQTLDLSHNQLENIPDYSFLSLKETLQYINIMSNNLSSVNASALFDGLFLRKVILHTNRIEMISGTFSKLKNLDGLHLENNRLTVVSKRTFYGLSKLARLTLGNNTIESIEEGVFDEYSNLQILQLDENQIGELPKDIFKFTPLLSELYVNRNNISRLDETIFEKCAQLKTVKIAFNQISSLKRLSFTSGRIRYIHMSNNKLSVLPAFTKPNSTDCYNFPTLREVNFYYNSITSINASCFQTLQVLGVSYNQITSMDGFGIMSKLTKLRMRHNQISTIPKLEMSKLCTTLIQLDLGENMIQNIAKGTFSNCKHLEILKLDKNSIRTFEPIPFSTFRDLRLSSNPFVCDCQNENFFDWVEFNMNVDVDNITCVTGEAIKDVHIGECTTSEWLKKHLQEIGIPIAVMLVLSLIVSGIIFKFRHEIQVIAFYKWNIRLTCCCTNKPGINTNNKYDAFVCFAEEDIGFVTDSLIPFLEPKYKLCVYYRDFPLGEDIAEAILDVINTSAIIIILLSQDFLKSRWGTFEFRNAHHAAITNEDKRMIIIVLEDSVINSKLDLTLRSVLYTKAYLKKGDKLFAEKLLHAMPVEPVEVTMKQNEDEEINMHTYQDTAIKRAGVGYMYDAHDDIEDHYDVIRTLDM